MSSYISMLASQWMAYFPHLNFICIVSVDCVIVSLWFHLCFESSLSKFKIWLHFNNLLSHWGMHFGNTINKALQLCEFLLNIIDQWFPFDNNTFLSVWFLSAAQSVYYFSLGIKTYLIHNLYIQKDPKLFFHANIERMSSIVVVDNPLFAFYDGSIFAIDKMLLWVFVFHALSISHKLSTWVVYFVC